MVKWWRHRLPAWRISVSNHAAIIEYSESFDFNRYNITLLEPDRRLAKRTDAVRGAG
jgi:hypothetical protein